MPDAGKLRIPPGKPGSRKEPYRTLPYQKLEGRRLVVCAPELMSDDAFVSAVEACTMPNEMFRHREHVRLSFVYLRRYGFDEARVRISAAIRGYALHNRAPLKYHETITIAWLRIVHQALGRVPADAGFESMVKRFPSLLNKRTLMQYYSSELLGTEGARLSFVEPNRRPLPELIRA